MIRTIFAVLFLVLSVPAFSAGVPSVKVDRPSASFELDGVPVGQVLRLVFVEVLKTPYVLDPAVLSDQRLVSFRWNAGKGDMRLFLGSFLDAMGYVLQQHNGADFVIPRPEKTPVEPESDFFVYRPVYRDAAYLIELVAPLFKGAFTSRPQIQQVPAGAEKMTMDKAAPVGSAAGSLDRKTDTLVFSGSALEIVKLQKILGQVDIAGGQVLVRGALYEVQTGKSDGSAFQMAASLLSGKFGLTLGAGVQPLANSLSVKTTGSLSIDAVLSALASDSRFKVVSSPSLRVRDGQTAKLTVGQDVPVLGALSYPQGAGQAVQSVEYRSSGVIFNLTPQIRGAAVDLQVLQQVSNFVQTVTGVNASPTLTKRELSTSVSLLDDDLVVLGGLNEDKESATNSGFSFLPDFMRSKSESNNKTEVLLILQVTRI